MMGRLGFPILMRHQMEIPELQDLLKQYEDERHAAGFDGPNQVTLQTNCYLAESREQVRADAEESTMLDRRIARARQAGNEGDVEAAIRLGRLRDEAPFEELTRRFLYGTPEEVVDRLQEYQATLGITGVSLNMNVGGQIPFDRVVNSMRLLMGRVAPRLN
jgi:alkanesulfonate monooxygenase SsuD/methylene tetrahydromethanopterin reductase-like flavin-dependent oxidoreductase (luciferase family)